MKTKDILALLDAGYTKEEIEAMEAGEDVTGDPETETKDQEKETEADEPEAGEDHDKPIQDLFKAVNDLTKTVQTMQKMNAKRADSGSPEPDKTAEDVIKDFFAPKEKG